MASGPGAAARLLRRVLDWRVLRIEWQRRSPLGPERLELLVELRLEAVPPERAHQELQAVALLVLVVAKTVEDAHDRFGDVEHLVHRREREQLVPRTGQRRRATRHRDPEPSDRDAVDGLDARRPADVVDRGADVIVGAALERDLELARQRRAQRMTQQVARQRLGVRGDVERLVGGDPRIRARRDVPHRVAAGLARGQPDVGETTHHELDVVQLQEVQLNVLARGDVAESARVALGDLRHRVELRHVENALRDLHPQHLGIAGLPLAVGAAHQPEAAPFVGTDLAALEPREHVHELVDVRLFGKRQPRPAQCLPIFGCRHDFLR